MPRWLDKTDRDREEKTERGAQLGGSGAAMGQEWVWSMGKEVEYADSAMMDKEKQHQSSWPHESEKKENSSYWGSSR